MYVRLSVRHVPVCTETEITPFEKILKVALIHTTDLNRPTIQEDFFEKWH